MRARSLLVVATALLLGFGVCPRADANPIGPNCGTCQGSIYDLTYSGVPISSTGTTQTWEITLSINTAGYNGGGTHLDSVAVKVSSQIVSADLISAPGGVANWFDFVGGLNANGCSGSGSGFDCVEAMALSAAPLVPGGTYNWVFDVEIANGGLFTGVDQSTIKARYVNNARKKVGALVSEGITLEIIPEPATLVLLLLGGSILAVGRARKR